MGEDFPDFRCDVVPERDRVRVVPIGEIDLATIDELEKPLHEMMAAGFERVVLDLREVTFIDSTGVRLVLALDSQSRHGGPAFSLIPGPEEVQRVFRTVGVLELLPFEGHGGPGDD